MTTSPDTWNRSERNGQRMVCRLDHDHLSGDCAWEPLAPLVAEIDREIHEKERALLDHLRREGASAPWPHVRLFTREDVELLRYLAPLSDDKSDFDSANELADRIEALLPKEV